jgi:hypothetical protein
MPARPSGKIIGAGAKRIKKVGQPGITSAINKALIMQGRQKIYKKFGYPIDVVFVGIDELKAGISGIDEFLKNEGSDILVGAAVAGVSEALSTGFSKKIGRDNKKWEPISPKTIEYRRARGYKSEELLVRGGALNKAVNEFGIVYQKSQNSMKGNKTFEPVNQPINATIKSTRRQRPESVNLRINKSVSHGTKHHHKDVELIIQGPGVINNFGTSFTGSNGRQIVVPARPFWYIDTRVTSVARRHVLNALNGVNQAVDKQIPRPSRTSLGQRARNKFIKNYVEAKSGTNLANMSKSDRLQYIVAEVTRRRAELKGNNPGKLMSRERARQKRGSNPWEYLDASFDVGMRDLTKNLMHARGTHVTLTYRRGVDKTIDSFEDLGKLIIGLDIYGGKTKRFTLSRKDGSSLSELKSLLKGTIDAYDAWKSSGDTSPFRGKNGQIKLRPGVHEHDVAYLRDLYNTIDKATVGKAGGSMRPLDRVVLLHEMWAVQSKFVMKERSGGITRKDTGKKVSFSRSRRHELAAFMETDAYGDILFSNLHTIARINAKTGQVEFSLAKIENESAASLARRRQRVAELNAKARNNALGHEFGTTAADLYMIAMGRLHDLQEKYNRYVEEYGAPPEMEKGTFSRQSGGKVYRPSMQELESIYAPFGTIVVPHQMKVPEGRSPLEFIYKTVDNEARQRALRYAVAHQVAAVFGAEPGKKNFQIVQQLIADYFGHTDTSPSIKYLGHVGKGGYHVGEKTTQFTIDSVTASNPAALGIQMRNQLHATQRAMMMMSRMMGEAWAESQIKYQENILKQAIRGYNRDSALVLGQGGVDEFSRGVELVMRLNAERDRELSERAGPGKRVYGPNYFTSWREGGWSPNIEDMNQLLFGDMAGLTVRPMQPQADRLMTKITAIGHKGRKTGDPILDDFQLVTRRSADWFEQGFVGVEEQIAQKIGLLDSADVSPMYKNILAFHTEGFKAHPTDDKILINESTGVTIPVSALSRIDKTNEVKIAGGTWWRASASEDSAGYKTSPGSGRTVNGREVFMMSPSKSIYGKLAQTRAKSQAGHITFQIIRDLEREQPELFSDISHVELYNVLTSAIKSAESWARVSKNSEQLSEVRKRYVEFKRDILSDTYWSNKWSKAGNGKKYGTSRNIIDAWLRQRTGLTLVEVRAGISYFLSSLNIDNPSSEDFDESIAEDEANQ